MNNLAEISFHFNIQTEEKLRCLNDVINRIDSWSEHQFWCGGEIPFKANIDRFEPGTEPIASWVARTPSGEQIAYLETYNTWHGRILARLWVDPDFRRLGIARKLRLTALKCLFSAGADYVGSFCHKQNLASKNLQLSMEFKVAPSPIGTTDEYLRIDRDGYSKLKATENSRYLTS